MLEILTGKSWTRTPSRHIALEAIETSAWTLFVLGFAVALVHTQFSRSLGLPGHHGLEQMTALLFARLISRDRWACVVVATGTAWGELVLGSDLLHNVRNVPLFLLSGGIVDMLYSVLRDRCRLVAFAALVGAVAHLSKPVTKLFIAAVTDTTFGFQRFGDVFPLLTHVLFGATGAAIGALLARAYLGARSDSKQE